MKKLLLLSAAISIGFNSMAQIPNYLPSNGLLSWWPFDGNANDESGNNNNGTVTGATLTTDRFGQLNNAYNFNGVDNYITMVSGGPAGNSDRTVSFWARTQGTGEMVPFDYGNANGSGGTFQIEFNNACAGVGLDVSNGVVTKGSNAFLDNNWHHFIIIVDATVGTNLNNIVVYVDGILLSSITCGALNQTQAINTVNTNPIVVGAPTSTTVRFFNGDIDDIGLWNRVLTQQEIDNLYNGCQLSTNTLAVTQNLVTLSANQSNANYQWLDCGNSNSVIVSATSQSYTPSLTGYYSVEVDMNGCKDTSDCYLVDFTGMDEITNESVSVYPNPTSDMITLTAQANHIGKSYFISDATGKRVLNGTITSTSQNISLAELANGIYNLIIESENKQIIRVVKE